MVGDGKVRFCPATNCRMAASFPADALRQQTEVWRIHTFKESNALVLPNKQAVPASFRILKVKWLKQRYYFISFSDASQLWAVRLTCHLNVRLFDEPQKVYPVQA